MLSTTRATGHAGEPATVPTLSVVDARGLAIGELESALLAGPVEGPRLTVVLAAPSAAIPPGAEVIDVGSLDTDEVRAILATYVDDAAADDVLARGAANLGWSARPCSRRSAVRRTSTSGGNGQRGRDVGRAGRQRSRRCAG